MVFNHQLQECFQRKLDFQISFILNNRKLKLLEQIQVSKATILLSIFDSFEFLLLSFKWTTIGRSKLSFCLLSWTSFVDTSLSDTWIIDFFGLRIWQISCSRIHILKSFSIISWYWPLNRVSISMLFFIYIWSTIV